MKSPAVQFYTGDFLSSPDVQLMEAHEVGGYCLLLFNAWQSEKPGFLPNDEGRMRRLARLSAGQWAESRELLLSKFPETEDKSMRYNPRMVAEAEKQLVRREKMSANGSKGGRPTKNQTESKGKAENNQLLSDENQKLSNPKADESSSFSSSTSSSLKETPPTPEGCAGASPKKNSDSENGNLQATHGGLAAEKEVSSVDCGAMHPDAVQDVENNRALNANASASHTGPAAADPDTRPEFSASPEWASQLRQLADQMATFWQLTNAQQDARMRLFRFCRTQFEAGHGELLTAQFEAYCAYKTEREERTHGWRGYLGDESQRYANGAWNEKDWVAALAEARKHPRHGNIAYPAGAAASASSGQVNKRLDVLQQARQLRQQRRNDQDRAA